MQIMQNTNDHQSGSGRKTAKRVTKIIITGCALIGYLSLTQPDQLPLTGLLVPFILLYLLLFQVILLFVQRPIAQLNLKQVSLTTTISALPVVLLVLSSLNQLSGWDIIVVFLFAIGVFIYLQYFNFATKD